MRQPAGHLVKKVLLSLMILGVVGTTVGSGTFASFNSTTTSSANTFASGSLQLSDQRDTGTVCFATGGTGPTGNANADNSTNSACTTLFDSTNASVKRPGEVATVDLTLQNLGTADGILRGYAASTCWRSNSSSQPYAGGTAASITGNTVTPTPVVITTGTNDKFSLTLDGTAYTDIQIIGGSYASVTTFATAVQNAIRLRTGRLETVANSSSKLKISTASSGAPSTIVINTPSASSALGKMAFTTGTAGTGAGLNDICAATRMTIQEYGDATKRANGSVDGTAYCRYGANEGAGNTCTFDATHDLADYLANFTSLTPKDYGTIAAGGFRYWRITLQVPAGSADVLQGTQANFDFTWKLESS